MADTVANGEVDPDGAGGLGGSSLLPSVEVRMQWVPGAAQERGVVDGASRARRACCAGRCGGTRP
jgi:hypothetical protein